MFKVWHSEFEQWRHGCVSHISSHNYTWQWHHIFAAFSAFITRTVSSWYVLHEIIGVGTGRFMRRAPRGNNDRYPSGGDKSCGKQQFLSSLTSGWNAADGATFKCQLDDDHMSCLSSCVVIYYLTAVWLGTHGANQRFLLEAAWGPCINIILQFFASLHSSLADKSP